MAGLKVFLRGWLVVCWRDGRGGRSEGVLEGMAGNLLEGW